MKKRVSKTKMAKSVGWEAKLDQRANEGLDKPRRPGRVKQVDAVVAQSIANAKRRALEEAAKLNAARALENSAAMCEVPSEGETVSGIASPTKNFPQYLGEEGNSKADQWDKEADVWAGVAAQLEAKGEMVVARSARRKGEQNRMAAQSVRDREKLEKAVEDYKAGENQAEVPAAETVSGLDQAVAGGSLTRLLDLDRTTAELEVEAARAAREANYSFGGVDEPLSFNGVQAASAEEPSSSVADTYGGIDRASFTTADGVRVHPGALDTGGVYAEYRPDGYGGVEKTAAALPGDDGCGTEAVPPRPVSPALGDDDFVNKRLAVLEWDLRYGSQNAPPDKAKPTFTPWREWPTGFDPEKKSEVAEDAVPNWAREAQERRDKAAADERAQQFDDPGVYVPRRPTPVNPDPLRDIKVAVTNYHLAEIPNFWDKLKQQIKRRFYERVEEFVERDRRKVVVVRMAQHSMNPMDMGEFKRQMSATGRTVVFLEYKPNIVSVPVIEELR